MTDDANSQHLSPEELAEIEDDPEADFDDTLDSWEIMLQEVVPHLTKEAKKYFFVPPGTVKKLAIKQRKPRGRTGKRKAESQSEENKADEGDSVKKTKVEATVYVKVEIPAAPIAKGKAAPPPNVISKGPFFITESLLPTRIEWRNEKPASEPRKPLADEAGYTALVKSFGTQEKDFVILVYMPPPAKDNVTWDTGMGDHIDKPFDYEKEVSVANSSLPGPASAKEQIAAISKKSANVIADLEVQYPVGKEALFPEKCVYRDGDKYWELTSLRLQVWAAAIITGTATIEKPPHNSHFSDAQKLKVPQPTTSGPAPATVSEVASNAAAPTQGVIPPAVPLAVPQLAHPPPGYPPYPPYYSPLPYYGYPYHLPPPHPYHPYHPQAPAPYAHPPHLHQPHLYLPMGAPGSSMFSPSTTSPQVLPGKVNRLNVSLEAFCERYGLPETNRQKLETLKYRPGMLGVDHLPEREWNEGAGFSVLEWTLFLLSHKQFLKDVRDSKWEPNK